MLGFCDKVLNFELDLDSNSIILALGLFLCVTILFLCHSFYSCLIRFIFLFMAGSCHHYNYVLTNSSVYRLWKEV